MAKQFHELGQEKREALQGRFWAKVDKGGANGCWLWTAGSSGSGYGRIGDGNGRSVAAHRLSWELVNGPIPKGLFVLHQCDIPGCVNPEHLFLGDAAANTRDMVGKERQRWRTSKGGAKTILLRLPPAMHSAIKDAAYEQGVSVNRLLILLIAGAIEFKFPDE